MADNVATAEIESIQFRMAGDEDNKRDAVVEITHNTLFAKKMTPFSGGCFDLRMGTTDNHFKCLTCKENKKNDPGHFGLLRMKIPLQSPLFVSETRRWLRMVCLHCGMLMLSDKKLSTVKGFKFLEASKLTTEGVSCPFCSTIHPKIIKTDDDYFSFQALYDDGSLVRLRPSDIKKIFEQVSQGTVDALGAMNHPKNLLLYNILILPPATRPCAPRNLGPDNSMSMHDLTTLIQSLILNNDRDGADPTSERAAVRETMSQQVYYDMIHGSASTTTSSISNNGRRGLMIGQRPTMAILRQLARKEGRIRKNLLGKRVWYISRSTISGNPQLQIDEVGFPQAFARILQVHETVQHYNYQRLMCHFINGVKRYPGCTRIQKASTGMVHHVTGEHSSLIIEIGDVLVRDVVTGDLGFLNRAPSLERSSIGVHRIVVLNDPSIHTFQLNVIACAWYNADFDGDQMNLWVPHTEMSHVEAETLSSVSNWFISTKSSTPVPGQVQDSNIGSFELTRSFTKMDKWHAMRCFAGTDTPPPSFSDTRVYTGREVVSALFVETPIMFSRSPRWFQSAFVPYINYDSNEIKTIMQRGELLQGVLDQSSVGAGASGGIFHEIACKFGTKTALRTMYALQQMAITFLGNRGCTVGLSDMVVTDDNLAEIHGIIESVLSESHLISDQLLRGELLPPIGMTIHEYYERLQQEALKLPDEMLRPIIASIDPDWNGLFKMVATGSKGSIPNLLHIMGGIGSIMINSSRMVEDFCSGRTSPYFARGSVEPEAYGFVKNSYVSGMNAAEFVFSSMNGRYDLINKALSTASTGYQNRKAIMALQSAIVDNLRRICFDVRVVQFLYGGDGLDARKVERLSFDTIFLSDEQLAKEFYVSFVDVTEVQKKEFDDCFLQLKNDRDWYRRTFMRFEDCTFSEPMSDSRYMPINVGRLVRDIHPQEQHITIQQLVSNVVHIKEFCSIFPYLLINEIQERLKTPVPCNIVAATRLQVMLIRIELAPSRISHLSYDDVEYILNMIRITFTRALVNYGEMAGILAAQAVSEPLTQYMLDSHHRSVGSGTNKAGIIRPAEIFGAKKVEQTAEMLIRLKEEYETDMSIAALVANEIELLRFSCFVDEWALLLESYTELRFPPFLADKPWIDQYLRLRPLIHPSPELTNWCIRFIINKSTMILKNISLEFVVERLQALFPLAFIVYPSETSTTMIIRVWLHSGQFRRKTNQKSVELIINTILDTTIRGVPNIVNAEVCTLKRYKVTKGGGLVLSDVYAISTIGSNLYGVMMNQYIDSGRVVSSSIGDTEKVYGIMAAKFTINREIHRVLGAQAPNDRHIQVYSEVMTMLGYVTSLERSGIDQRERNNVLLRMGMSAPAQVLQDAVVHNLSIPRIYGHVPPLLMGSAPIMGTIYNKFEVDEELIQATLSNIEAEVDTL